MYGKESSSITPGQIKKLAEEMKKINKNIDLKNPLFSKTGESIVSSVLNEGEKDIHTRKERQLDVDDINRKKNLSHINEGEKDKWKRMMKYDIPDDETREL
jgi:hypothetical protein